MRSNSIPQFPEPSRWDRSELEGLLRLASRLQKLAHPEAVKPKSATPKKPASATGRAKIRRG